MTSVCQTANAIFFDPQEGGPAGGANQMDEPAKALILGYALLVSRVNLLDDDGDFEQAVGVIKNRVLNGATTSL